MKTTRCFVFVLCNLAALGLAQAQAASFEGLGFLPGYTNFSEAYNVSSDGSVVVGWSRYTYGQYGLYDRAFRWTRAGGMVNLGVLGLGLTSQAWGASSDGSVVVGNSDNGSRNVGFRWTNTGGMEGLGFLPDPETWESAAFAISADGLVIVGESQVGPNHHAVRWTSSPPGIADLGALPGYSYNALAVGASANGSVVVGHCQNDWPLYEWQAFRWTNGPAGITALGFLPGGASSEANAVSVDGAVIVGGSESTTGWQACRWSNGAITGLGSLPGYTNWITAFAVSSDGSVIVGESDSATDSAAFIWDSAHGMRNLQSVLAGTYGLNLAGWSLKRASGISADGNTIVGYGTDPGGKTEAWLAVLAEPSPLVLTNATTLNGVFSFTILSPQAQGMAIEYSTTLAPDSWVTLLTTNSPGGQVRITESATNSHLYYRARKGY
jgi:probable HAF family extracellular repeat protein